MLNTGSPSSGFRLVLVTHCLQSIVTVFRCLSAGTDDAFRFFAKFDGLADAWIAKRFFSGKDACESNRELMSRVRPFIYSVITIIDTKVAFSIIPWPI